MKFAVRNMITGKIVSQRFNHSDEAEDMKDKLGAEAFDKNEYSDGMFEVKLVADVFDINIRNNFLRIFELPDKLFPESPKEIYATGKFITLKMVYAFIAIPSDNPAAGIGTATGERITWEEFKPQLIERLKEKLIIHNHTKYLVMTDFNDCFIVTRES